MKLVFKGITNDKDVWINYISFRLSSGEIIVIDRTITHYAIENGHLDMYWRGCHTCKPGKKNDYTLKPQDFKGAEIVDISVRTDAPERYFVKITEWKAEDS